MYNVMIDLDGTMVKVAGQNRKDAHNKAITLYKQSMRVQRISSECRQMVENFLIEDLGR